MGLISYRRKREIQEKALSDFFDGAAGKRDKDTLVIIPAYNEEHAIAQVISSTRGCDNCDILVVDDGSTDSTADILKESRAIVITHSVNIKGNFATFTALEAGFALGYDYIIKIDGDNQHRVEDVGRISQLLKQGSADLIIGSRYIHPDNTWNDFGVKDAGRRFSCKLVSILTGHKVTDTTSGLRGWNRKATGFLVREFKRGYMHDDLTFNVEQCIIALKGGLEVLDIPVVMNEREGGESKEYNPRSIKMWSFPPRLILMVLKIWVASLIFKESPQLLRKREK